VFKTVNDGKMPTRGSKYSAAVDLYASEDMTIGAGETKIIGLGVEIDKNKLSKIARFYTIDNMPKDIKDGIYSHYVDNHTKFFYSTHYLQLNPRSSLRAKGFISHTGIIDMDYNKEIKIIIHNPIKNYASVNARSADFSQSNELNFLDRFKISKGDRIAQITLIEHKGYLMGIESEDERDGGIGSSGDR